MTIPAEYAPALVGVIFAALAFAFGVLDDWRFKREMERLDQKEQSKRDERAKWQTPL